ncbi:HET-domain-containing protein, partial [Trichodelitschia bisporula]
MEETYVWAGFILGLILIWPFLFIRLLSYSYIMYALLISLISLRIDQLAIPKGVFWTCFTLLLPSAFVNNSLGTPLMSMIIFFYFWTNHAYWAPTAFVIDFGIFLAFLPPTVTWSQILAWLVALATLGHNTIVWDMPWPWVAAWAALAVALKLSFPPDLHMSWYVLSASLILALAAATRPDQSLERFLAWTAAIALTRPLLSVAYKPLAPYLRDPVKLITAIPAFWESKWRLRKPLWYPVSARAAVSGMQPTSRLCAKCGRFTARSDLIMGSRKYLVRLVEWHSYHPTTADLWRSAREVSPCHLCHLFWYSIGEGRRREIVLGAVWPRAGRVKEKLRVRVVERRPLSSYTYVQLFLGERPVGVRLLVHREVRLDKLSLASQFPRTDSDEHFKQIKEWLEMCSTCHPQCSGVGSAPHALPTRLVYIEPEQPASQSDPPSLNVNLVETAQLADHDVKYLALSHCWGSTVPLRLVTDTYAPFLSSIPFHSLAKNMQHALLATHRLGFSYIWIDSLCIIQDSATDWVAEGARMATVYSGATLTLASTSSASSAGGLFHTRSPLSLRPCIIGYSSLTALLPSTIIARPDDITAFTHSIDQSILNTRAWVLQERLLSRRIAHFATNMLAWECASRSASELSTRGYVFKRYPEDFTDFYAPNAARIRNTTELAAALKLVRATSWLAHEAIRRRPPHLPDADPDAPVAKASAWTERRAFWAQARKAEDGSWASDSSDHVRAGFRAAFAGLLKGTYLREEGGAALIGPGRFSYAWFEIVGAYSRARVSFARDRWLALEGVVAE